MSVRCVGAIVQNIGKHDAELYKAVLIYEDKDYRYTFEKHFNKRVEAKIWVDKHNVEMPQYFDRHTKFYLG